MLRRLVLLGAAAVLAFFPLTTYAAAAWTCVYYGANDWECSDGTHSYYVVCDSQGQHCTYYQR
jgi:hypothetical protein